MTLYELLEEKKVTKAQLSRMSGLPYSTICDLVNGKTELSKSSVEVALKIAKSLGMTLDGLIHETATSAKETRMSFERFKNTLRHRLKDLGDLGFIADLLQEDLIEVWFRKQWYPEALYALGMLDLVCRLNGVPLALKYENYRYQKLDRILYPEDVLLISRLNKDERVKIEYFDRSYPEFKRFNIAETEIRYGL